MKIVYVVKEAYPFIKTGGLGDVAGSFPKFIAKEGLKISVCLPLYENIDTNKYNIQKTDLSITVDINNKRYIFDIYKHKNQVKFYFFKNDKLFKAKNNLKFIIFSHAVVQFLNRTGFIPDIIHTNNWESALISVIIKTRYHRIFSSTRTVLTIHNILEQGIFPESYLSKSGIDKELLDESFLLHNGRINILKGGIIFSDAVTTVSPTYMKEICTPEYGAGLDLVLKKHCHKLYGILNGIDYSIWNPEKDSYIYQNYSYNQPERKKINKDMFLKDVGLTGNDKPLIVFIGKLKKEHGIDLLIKSIEELAKFNANFAVLGTGDRKYNQKLESLQGKYKNIFIKVAFDENLSRKLYSAGDFFLKPSIYEPCGISHMIAMRYGNVVIARKTGGLIDTVKDISQKNGYGILFDRPYKKELLFSIERALNLYKNQKRFVEITRYVSTLDFSWEEPVAKYIRLYESLRYG